MKILITGGAGYIGSHTIIEILENTDWEIISVDDFSNSSEETYQKIKRITGKEIRGWDWRDDRVLQSRVTFKAKNPAPTTTVVYKIG